MSSSSSIPVRAALPEPIRFERFPASEHVVLVHGGAGAVPEASRAAHAAGCLRAAHAGAEVLRAGGRALDAVCAAVIVLEDDPLFNAGTGACLDESGALSLDAAVMDGQRLDAGAVACLPAFANPVRIALRVLEAGGPILLSGEGARVYAVAQGFAPAGDAMVTSAARANLADAKTRGATLGWAGGTVGAVARDARGHVAAATSTGGKTNKKIGRVGDTPILGAGTYADDALGAASATGDGEAFMRLLLSKSAVDALAAGRADAAREVIAHLGARLGALGGILLVSPRGEASFARNTETMSYGVVGPGFEVCGT
ncbi:MAG: isoaspartyl peptidase/L-asparaginase [Myxococcales bacterium]|nr:isoaspartyl peptidase/L-asparaginase [Myxococcales bacterium]MBL0193769.1 isoaspartyl peptidase/L-asparaginase [Myxococcales bacterium]